MLKAYNAWRTEKRHQKMKHPVKLDTSCPTGSAIFQRLEKTNVDSDYHRAGLHKDPITEHYWVREYREQGQGQWDEYFSMDKQTGEAVLRYPEMLHYYLSHRQWVIPNTDSIEHPAKLSTQHADSVGAQLFERLQKLGISDQANGAEILHDPENDQYWLATAKTEGDSHWAELMSLYSHTAENILRYPQMLAKYGETGDWIKPSEPE